MIQNYFEKDFATISYNEEHHAVVHKWLVTPTQEEFREGMNAIILALGHFKTGKVVADTTHLGAIHPDDQKWSATDWNERALKAGFSHNALIVPADIFTQISVEDVIGQVVINAVTVEYFKNMEEALKWIKAV